MRKASFRPVVALLLPLLVAVAGCDVVTGWAGRVGVSSEGSETETAATSSRGNVYYQYVDDSGSVRFVQNKAEIPAKYRGSAGRIEVEKHAPAPAPAAAPARGNIWKDAAEAPWSGGDQEVVMYTAPWCGVCRRAEAFFEREGVRYTAKDIEANDGYKRELVQKTGRSAVPVIEVGKDRMIGFDQRQLERLLSL